MQEISENKLIEENKELRTQLEEYKQLVDAIKNGNVDALAIKKNGQADIFSLESTDFVYRVLVENFAESALNVTDKGLIIYANPAFEKLLGSSNSSLIGNDIYSLIDPSCKRTFSQMFKDAFSGQSKGELTLLYKKKKIQVYISLSSLYPRFPGVGIIITDLSQKKQQEEVISNYKSKLSVKEEELLQAEIAQKSTEKFRTMGNTIPQKVWTADAKGEMDYFNQKWLDYSTLSFAELKGKGWKKIIHADDWQATEKAWRHCVETGLTFEIEHRLLNKTGTYRWHLSRALPQKDELGNRLMWVGTTTDVHVQKNFSHELENRVHQATVFLQTIFDSSEEFIASFDNDLKFTSMNKVAEKYIKIGSSEVIGKDLLQVLPDLKDSKYYETIQRVLKGDIVHNKENIKIGEEDFVFDAFYKPLIIADEVTGVLIVARDITSIISITESLQLAKQQLEEHTKSIEGKNNELTNANEELKSFTYIASHDLREPLRKIMMFMGRILAKVSLGELSVEVKGYFDRISAATTHMQNLIDALLRYSEMNDKHFELVETNLNELVEEVKENLLLLIEDKGAMIKSDPLPTIMAMPSQIKQLFSNLISNSIKYSNPEKPPVIEITVSKVAARDIITEFPIAKNTYWKIVLKDNGIGFDQMYHFKIFELFQRLHDKDKFSGTGIGLSICNKVVQNHNGFITADGHVGEGSEFNIFLPVSQN
jgi:PAS domain S-box-containing protein